MGCSSSASSLEPIDQIIQSQMIPLPNQFEELLTKFTEAETTLQSIEVFRRNLIDKREKVAYKTGSCVKKNPTLENSIESFLWTLANLSEGDVDSYEVTFNKDEDPYFSISNADDTFNDVALIINNYISSLYEIKNTLNETKGKMEQIIIDLNTNYKRYENRLLDGLSETDKKYKEYQSIYENNTGLLKKIEKIHLLDIIYNNYVTDTAFLDKLPSLLIDDDYIDRINEVGKNSKEKGYYPLYDTYFYNIRPEERWKEFPGEAKEEAENKVQLKTVILANKTFGG